MKVVVAKLDPAEVRKTHPIDDRVHGWFFGYREQSNNAWRITGTDLWGRTVGTVDDDIDRGLNWCIEAAKNINAQLADRSKFSD